MTEPKYLRDLGVALHDLACLPEGVDPWEFNLGVQTILELLLEEIPQRLLFPGVAKVHLTLGTPLDQVNNFIALGVAFWNDPDFDVEAYWKLPRQERQREILSRMEVALIAVAHRLAVPDVPLREAADRVRARDLPVRDFTRDEMRARYGLVPGVRSKRGPKAAPWSPPAAEPGVAADVGP